MALRLVAVPASANRRDGRWSRAPKYGLNCSVTHAAAASISDAAGGSDFRNMSVTRREPQSIDRAASRSSTGSPPSPRSHHTPETSSVEPPPRSHTSTGSSSHMPHVAPRKDRNASRSPEMIAGLAPKAASRSTNSGPSAASRIAEVATASTRSTPSSRHSARNSTTTPATASAPSGESRPVAERSLPRCVMRVWRTTSLRSSPSTSATRSLVETVPMSIAARRWLMVGILPRRRAEPRGRPR